MLNCFKRDTRFIPISVTDIEKFQEKYGVILPDALREFYINHNGNYIHTVYIPADNDRFEGEMIGVHEILPLQASDEDDCSVEYIKDKDLSEPWIDPKLVPFAIDECGDVWYWDMYDGKVCIVFDEDEDENGMLIPWYVCSSVEEMFKLMNEAYEKDNKE